ncbi:MAG TPA: TldD/PmbA family protein [Candidatus Baltobacteraceae bacterium]|nr:TldD/PmbA family protein [Candidatus Baltobacteraceae bacterium]
MLEAQREALAAGVLDAAGAADQAEVSVFSSDASLTRFTHEVSNQNVSASDVVLSVRAVVGGRTGVAATNRLDDASLKDLVERAMAMARLAPSDPQQPPLPTGAPTTPPAAAYDEATADAGAALRAQMCETIFTQAEREKQWCAGYVSTARSGFTVVNTSGARASFDGTDAGLNVKMNASDSTGFAESHSPAVAAVDAAATAHTASAKARDSAAPQAVEAGAWTVILEPSAFGELFAYLGSHFSAQSFEEGSSFCSDGLDRSYFGENVSVYDDYAHPLNPGMPFDYEGQPTLRLPLVDGGVVRNVVTDSYYAAKLNRPNTGHALPAPNAQGPQARNLVVAAGSKPLAQLVEETKRGLLITRFWYIRTVDQKKAIVTGMTRDGTFLIENGRIAGGVRNLRFNQSILDALRGCELSNEQKRTGGYHYSIVTPALKVDNFHFSSTTQF